MNSISKLLRTHRSIRRFKSISVPRNLIADVCGDAIAGTPSAGNLNTVSIITTRNSARRRKLYETHEEQEMILQAPILLTFCAEVYRTRRWLALRCARDNFNNMEG